ncbi:hypothetical protein EIP91_004902 [Steccherinum ochraceum]|uniref:C2H2-type domain-containing protein n=1 Tax=Steccherinum ochraceum TaxID=92696 RepID=A0A4R0RE52_9APHY|nr:hypothetical protein EIP91_004902 [Steccherinum ochraceum]
MLATARARVRARSRNVTAPPEKHRCGFCNKKLPTLQGVKAHIQNAPSCRKRWEVWMSAKMKMSTREAVRTSTTNPLVGGPSQPSNTLPTDADANDSDSDAMDFEPEFFPPSFPEPPPAPEEDPSAARPRPTVEEVPDEDDIRCFVERYPHEVATVFGKGLTAFEEWRKQNAESKRCRYAPFKDAEEWEMARWMVLNLGANQVEEFLKLRMVENHCHMTASSKYLFFKDVDSLPTGTPWICDEIEVTGDSADEDGNVMKETVELWRRDPVECIRELIGNPAFRDALKYEPERLYTDTEGTSRRYDEMSSGNWWWKVQEKLPAGATVAPVILASDKTQLSQFRGDQVAWPVYLSIGNIAKATRRQVSARATILVGYLPTSKLECFLPSNRSLAGYRLYHHCMSILLESIKNAGTQGVPMLCADGGVRKVFPILAAYIADHPEQCLVTCVKESYCPRGTVPSNQRGEASECLLRSVATTLDILDEHQRGLSPPDFEKFGIRPVYEPFWRSLPHCDIFACITPDVLHQLHKGVFKDHLVKWCTKLVGDEEIDRRFKAMADVPDLRHFKKGISTISQWTGAEHKEMQKVFVALLVGAVEPRVLAVAQAIVDFIYFAQFQVHTAASLHGLRSALQTFHANKDVFVETEVRSHFNIPKVHAMEHYLESIEELGAADGYNTELPERLHIDFAKLAYRAGNHKDYIANMTRWLQRREAVDILAAFLSWLDGEEHKEAASQSNTTTGSVAEEEIQVVGTRRGSLTTRLAVGPVSDVDLLLHRGDTFGYRISKKPAFRSVTVAQITEKFQATQFLPAFKSFVDKYLSHAPVSASINDKFHVFKQVSILLPRNDFIGSRANYDRVRAIPAQPQTEPRRPATPAYFDTALIIEDPDLFEASGRSGLIGIRAARVRMLFELPPQFGPYPHRLAYIEWYTSFGRIDQKTRMYQVTPSTRNRRPNAAVVSVDRIHRLCHLVGKPNDEKIDRSWTSENVLDTADEFLVNPYLSVDLFSSRTPLYR